MDVNSLQDLIETHSITAFQETFKNKGPEIFATGSKGYSIFNFSILHTSIDDLSEALETKKSDEPVIERYIAAVRFFYQKSDKNYTILHALDGYDEISLTGATKVISNKKEDIIMPDDFDVETIDPTAIFGGDSVQESAEIFMKVISGQGTEAQNNVVFANAGMAIATVKSLTPKEGFDLAKESLLSGKAKERLDTLIDLSK